METALYLARTRESALACVQQLCEDIKCNEAANHKLYFSRRMMGAYVISKGEEIDGKRTITGDRELIIFPASRTEDIERLNRGKTITELRDAMYLVGDGEKKMARRVEIINWLLDDSAKNTHSIMIP